jgi:hypothetical protein
VEKMVNTFLDQDFLRLLSSSKKKLSPNIDLPFSKSPLYARLSLESFLSVDFKKVIKNAQDQGIDLQEIAIQYEDLTDEEINLLGNHQVITNNSGSTVLAKFPLEGMPILQTKAKYVHYLGA